MKMLAAVYRLCIITIVFGNFSQIFSDAIAVQEISVADLVAQNNTITYIKCDDAIPFNYQPFPFMAHEHLQLYHGSFAETFILKIPNGRAQSHYGWVIIDDVYFINEMNWKHLYHHHCMIDQVAPENISKLPGRVVVLGQLGFFQYWHWLSEILCRLAMVEQQGIEYDWLYVPFYDKFMKETFDLWGIDTSKIIEPVGQNYAICADELILPSLVSNLHYGFVPYSCYPSHHLFDWVSQKLLQEALQRPVTCDLSKRIFVSRHDAPGRHVTNEDEVFELFEKHGFVRYQLSHLSIADQIQLFHQAEMIAGPAGTGITANSLYCKPGTKIIELFQALGDCTMWIVAQHMQLAYTGVQTTDFVWDYQNCFGNTTMQLDAIERVLSDLAVGNLQSHYPLYG